MESKELMVVTQLPVIEERLKQLSEEVEKKVENAKSLVCTEENVKTIKQVRADLNKEFINVETQRKAIKEQILAPYMQFEEVYKQYISDKYKSADKDLKQKIDVVESELKAQKENEIREYFDSLKNEKNIDFIKYEQAKINVTLTASKKSLREQVESFINKISDDLKLIETQEHKAEILVEYKQSLNVSNAITTVLNRVEAVKNEKRKQEELINERLEEEKNKIQENLNNLANANITENEINTAQEVENLQVQPQEKTYTITFTVTGTAPKLKELKDYMLREGLQYE